MAIPSKIDHVEKGLSRLLSQFKDKPVIQAFLSSYLSQLDTIQEDTFYLLNNRGIDNAEGVFLDNLGKLVGESRLGRNDEDYRKAILARIYINNSDGTPINLIEILKTITKTEDVKYFEHYPANVHMSSNGVDLEEAAKLMPSVAPAGASDVTIIGVDKERGAFTPSELVPDVISGNWKTSSGDLETPIGQDYIFNYKSDSDNNLAKMAELGDDVLELFDGNEVSDAEVATDQGEDFEVFDGTTVSNLVTFDGTNEDNLFVTYYIGYEPLEVFGVLQETGSPPWAEIYNKKYIELEESLNG